MLRLVAQSANHLRAAMRSGDTAFADGLVADALSCGEPAVDVLSGIAAALQAASDTPESERRARFVTEHLLAVTFPSLLKSATASADRVLVAGAPGESHALGLRLAACTAESAGYDVHYLGASLEPFALARLVAVQHPVAVIVGAEEPDNLPALHQAIAAVHVSAPDAQVIAFGATAAGRTRILGATVAEDIADVARLLARHAVALAA